MVENPKWKDMGSDTPRSSSKPCELDNIGTQKISVPDQANRLQCTNFDSDSFVVDMERLSLITEKDITPNSRLPRNFSRKVSSQKKNMETTINPSTSNEKDAGVVASTSSPRAPSAVDGRPEKPMVVTVETTKDQPTSPHVHHQITIMTGNVGVRNAGERRWSDGKRFSFRRSSPSWAVDPRRILLFFATLSSMGTILLICFTLSISKQSGDASDALN